MKIIYLSLSRKNTVVTFNPFITILTKIIELGNYLHEGIFIEEPLPYLLTFLPYFFCCIPNLHITCLTSTSKLPIISSTRQFVGTKFKW